MEESKLEGISKEWLNEYRMNFSRFSFVLLRLKLCTSISCEFLSYEIGSRVQRLSSQHTSKGVGFRP